MLCQGRARKPQPGLPGPGEYPAKRILDTPRTTDAVGRVAGAFDPETLPSGERGALGNVQTATACSRLVLRSACHVMIFLCQISQKN